MTPASLGSTICYHGNHGTTSWEGRVVQDHPQFESFLKEVVAPRILDTESRFDQTIRALGTTGMKTEYVEEFLNSNQECREWEVGEALAECALQHDSGRQIVWPWNTVRDRRSPRASLQGADLVGFRSDGDSYLLLIGEVKTSSDLNTPPNVIYGHSGMMWQLQNNATKTEIHHAIIKWLFFRCTSAPYQEMYKEAVARFLGSSGLDFIIMGVLIRDTAPNDSDFKNRAKALASTLHNSITVELIAWYLPIPISKWPSLLQGVTQ